MTAPHVLCCPTIINMSSLIQYAFEAQDKTARCGCRSWSDYRWGLANFVMLDWNISVLSVSGPDRVQVVRCRILCGRQCTLWRGVRQCC